MLRSKQTMMTSVEVLGLTMWLGRVATFFELPFLPFLGVCARYSGLCTIHVIHTVTAV